MKKKILIRIGSLRHGGAEKVLVTFLKNIPPQHYEIDLLLNLHSGKYLNDVPGWINIIYLNQGEMITTNRLQDLPKKAYRKIYQAVLKKFPKLLYNGILKGKKYDLEIAAIHGMRDEILNSPIKSSKKIVWIHNDLKKTESYHYSDDEIRKFFSFDTIMVISDQIQDTFFSLAKNDQERNKIIRIYNPLDTDEILIKSKAPVLHYDFDASVPTFVSVGTVFPQKGFDRLLRVHQKLLKEGLQHNILIIGDGYDFENIKKLKSDLGLDNSVTMLGFTDNPYPYIREAGYFVLSSRYEGFPTVLFEAITLKKNIIATRVSGVDEMLQNGQLGLITDNSEEGIYTGMKQALTQPESFSGYQHQLKNYRMPFDLENSVKAILRIIDNP
ncbi:Glycosyltransferase involved in cell wall bisynthesis [Epilithonimonas bovis DSM 19482]|uniref:Glycosyltransferase involved in cell wall bisynthesis n=1 Tax=Epilithonimonas bovis DSM 19482 TaxID=1121284 RepID=A0A1U7PUC3_9FLAO|nr:glycosyltransferase [Epilithonimonas bovis]SIT95358.1 Glycosyltransferase involved in cell wall bisynthesis [Epilithonimonas bovis DSM 19482]